MKKTIKKVCSMVLALTTLSVFAASCKKNNNINQPATETNGSENAIRLCDNGEVKYTLVRSDTAGKVAIRAMVLLNNAIEEATGMTPELTTDYDDGEDYSDRYEILIGATTRTESQQALQGLSKGDFCIRVTGKKIVIAGTTDTATQKAVKAFIAAYITGKTAETAVVPLSYTYQYVRNEHLAERSLQYVSGSKEEYQKTTLTISTNSNNSDQNYLIKNTANAMTTNRYADGKAELIYYFDISEMMDPVITMELNQSFTIEISDDGVKWNQWVTSSPRCGKRNLYD